MKLLLKNTFRNMFLKPFRAILIIGTVFICSLSALFCFDFAGVARGLMACVMSENKGDVQIGVLGNLPDGFPLTEDIGEFEALKYYYTTENIYSRIEGEYAYIKTEMIYVVNTDVELANKLGILSVDTYPSSDDKLFLTEEFANKNGYKEGDTIILHDFESNECEFTIEKILPEESCQGLFTEDSALLTREGLAMLVGGEQKLYTRRMEIHLLDKDRDVTELVEKLTQKYPSLTVMNYVAEEAISDLVDNVAKLFYIMFAICILMTLLITNSISERIVMERMQLIGTYRSLGIGTDTTTVILLLENMLYALLGSIPAVVLYILLREVVYLLITALVKVSNVDFGSINFVMVALVIIGAIALECVSPIKELLKAVKTSIRDIIFSNKDTEYKLNKVTGFVGLGLVVVSLVMTPFIKNVVVGISMMACLALALFLLYPFCCRFIAGSLSKLADKKSKPLCMLALREVYSKKSTVGCGVLISTAVALAMMVVLIAQAFFIKELEIPFSSDVEIEVTSYMDNDYFSYVDKLEGVTDVEEVHVTVSNISINDEKALLAQVYMLPEGGYEYYPKMSGEKYNLENDEIIVNNFAKNKYGLKVGDVVKIVFESGGLFPFEKEMRVVGVFDDFDKTVSTTVYGINEKTYFDMFDSVADYILIKSDNPQQTADEINKYSYMYLTKCQSYQDAIKATRKSSFSTVAIIGGVLGLTLILTFIGVTSNFLIGFEGRKRECAVMCSTAMSKSKLKKMLFYESFFCSGISIVLGILFGSVMSIPLKAAVDNFNFGLEITVNWFVILGLALVLWTLFSMTSIFVMKSLRKMNIAIQLKYE